MRKSNWDCHKLIKIQWVYKPRKIYGQQMHNYYDHEMKMYLY